MKYKLLATDLDGTLLNSKSEVSEHTRKTILAAIEQGMLFVPSTGRPLCGVERICEMFPGDFPVITYNGAAAMTSKTQRVLFSQDLKRGDAKEIYELGVERGVPIIIWEGETLHVSHICFEIELYQKITGATLHVLENFDALSVITKIIWLVQPEDGRQLTLALGERFAGRMNVHTSHPCLLEFVDVKASKGLALQAIGEAHGITADEIIAAGDGFNDVSMLKYAGLSVAMSNAPEDIRALCKHVTCSNDEDGVAKVIEEFVLGGRNG